MATPAKKDILLVGFGAVGAMYSHILERSGLTQVTSVARSNYERVKAEGLHIKSKKYGEHKAWRPYRLCNSVASATDRPYSYVFVTTKCIPELSKNADILAPLINSHHGPTTYVLLQNGLGVELDLYEALQRAGSASNIVSTALYIGTNMLEPNVVEHNMFDRVQLGVYRHGDFTTLKNTPKEELLLRDLEAILAAGGTTASVVPEIQRAKFAKNFWNVAFSSYATLTGYTVPALFRPPPSVPGLSYAPYVFPATADLIAKYTLPAIEAALHELVSLGRALGFEDNEAGLPSSAVKDTMEHTRVLHVAPDNTHKPSMMLDAEKGVPIEVEVILGSVVRLARERSVPVPRIEMLYGLLLVVQNQILRKRASGSV
ncbi:6-phosphogluconate dehydrogenase C-terminal domain-like protein [Fistulina hepatica ATCC 64428]|uniref:6-phosphogluconate dehydrogenase C-terminal domain-like protein n=1 Tax=Fistulina hepatica ATCC 64428 TaxID=1128425 RepID=A0A0D7AEK3_9AGAR|nr:6-phosphogluconate dehydrogenase C-terminal domain-like protein [Fistulina hepatica ATCC 64428]